MKSCAAQTSIMNSSSCDGRRRPRVAARRVRRRRAARRRRPSGRRQGRRAATRRRPCRVPCAQFACASCGTSSSLPTVSSSKDERPAREHGERWRGCVDAAGTAAAGGAGAGRWRRLDGAVRHRGCARGRRRRERRRERRRARERRRRLGGLVGRRRRRRRAAAAAARAPVELGAQRSAARRRRSRLRRRVAVAAAAAAALEAVWAPRPPEAALRVASAARWHPPRAACASVSCSTRSRNCSSSSRAGTSGIVRGGFLAPGMGLRAGLASPSWRARAAPTVIRFRAAPPSSLSFADQFSGLQNQ